MYIRPTAGAALAEEHHRDLMRQASASRQARAARQARPRNSARRPLIVRALRTAAAASAIAAGAFLVAPAGPGPAPAAHGNWYMHYRASDSHRAVVAVSFKEHRFGVSHHFQADPGSDFRWA
jgi:hypothetical protein